MGKPTGVVRKTHKKNRQSLKIKKMVVFGLNSRTWPNWKPN